MTPKRKQFCHEYVKDFNATQAAKRAGFSDDTAHSQGSRLLQNVEIKALIAKLSADVQKEAKIDAAYVLRQAVKLHERCMQELDPVMVRGPDGPEQEVTEDGRPIYKFDSTGAKGALDLIGKHVDVQAWKDKLELSGNVNIAERVTQGRKRAGKSD